MKRILPFMILASLFCSVSFASEWKSPADLACGLPPDAVVSLENKKDKTPQDIYMLTIIYYREFQRSKLKKLFQDHEKQAPAGPEMKLLAGIVLMRDHRHQESREVLTGVAKTHPDFYPAQTTLAHLAYLQKDFDRSYRIARQMIEKKKELSRFHLALCLMLATGAQGAITKKSMLRAIPAYFEVNRYLKEAQKQMPDSAEVLYAVGSYYLLMPAIVGGDLDRAIFLLERSRRLTPLNPGVYVRLAQAYRARGDAAASEQNIARAIELDPHDELLQDDLSGKKDFLDVP
ncbi:MAG: hypothetical protein K4571_17210 [Deltaproteobacteria bacterium]